MSTDRELLELAAKAAGYDYAKHGGYIVVDGIPGNWNPLVDDGDALRLAVDLRLQVECMAFQSAARNFKNDCAGCVDHSAEQKYPGRDFTPDKYAATRRAIVRAAAEIGRAAP